MLCAACGSALATWWRCSAVRTRFFAFLQSSRTSVVPAVTLTGVCSSSTVSLRLAPSVTALFKLCLSCKICLAASLVHAIAPVMVLTSLAGSAFMPCLVLNATLICRVRWCLEQCQQPVLAVSSSLCPECARFSTYCTAFPAFSPRLGLSHWKLRDRRQPMSTEAPVCLSIRRHLFL